MTTMTQLRFRVPGMTCDHCVNAVTGEIEKVSGVTKVDVDLTTKWVDVEGTEDVEAVRAAVDEAGYEADL
jgi:copper ion binding protein